VSGVEPRTVPCERCGRRVVDGSFDFGIGLALFPTCSGVEVRVRDYSGTHPAWKVLGVVSADELRHFLSRAYGDPAPVAERERRHLEKIRDYALRCLDGDRSSNVAIESVLALARDGLADGPR
jgi:hypothetical protein